MEILNPSPLLDPTSPLDDHSRELIRRVYEEEQAFALQLPTDDPLDPKRRKRVEFTLTEMWDQPHVIRNCLDLEKQSITETAEFIASRPLERVYMTGCGDSVACMIGVRAFYERVLGIPCEAIQALDLTYYNYEPINERTLVITLSSSGATTKTVEAMLLARAQGAMTLTLTNTPGSPLMVESDRNLLIHAQRKGWPTQSSTAAMAMLYQLAIHLGNKKGYSHEHLSSYQSCLDETPELIRNVLETQDTAVQQVAESEAGRSIYLFTGGGPAYASALFGAAKVRECSPDHAIAIPLEEYHHYNSQKSGDPLFLIAPKGPSIPRASDTAQQGRRWGGKIYSIVTQGEHTLEPYSDRVFSLPDTLELLSPLVYTVPVQMFAYHVAMAKFHSAESDTQSRGHESQPPSDPT